MLLLIKSCSDRRSQDLLLFARFRALGAAIEVVFHPLPFVGGESVKDVIVQDFFRDVPSAKIGLSVLLPAHGFEGNLFPFDTLRLSERMLLSHEDGGAGSTGD